MRATGDYRPRRMHDQTPDEAPPEGVEAKARPTPRGGSRSWAKWVALGFLGVAIAMVASTVRGTAFVYSKYVDEIMAPGEARRWVGRTVRVEGLVVPASIENRPGTSEYRFRVSRNRAVLPVRYAGVVPDTFRDCAGVTVRGQLGEDGTFVADEIVAKCPSRYEAATVVNGECIIGMSPERGGSGAPPVPAPLNAR